MKFSFHHKMMILIFSFSASFHPFEVSASLCGKPVIQLGVFSAKQGRSQHINIQDLIGDDFSVKKSSYQNFLVGLGYYFDGPNISQASIQYGINVFYLAPARVKGNVKQENLFTNLSYHYHRTNYPIYWAAKALIPCGKCYDITIDLGIGPNIVSTGGFKEKSLDGGITIPDNIFSRKTNVVFSATAGFGLRLPYIFGKRMLEINYRFFYLGQGELRKVNRQVRNTLRTGNSYANALIFTISI